jgi:hypothetical protein
MGTLFQDLRYGLRMLVKNPGFSGVAVLTLALGIGANTSLFTLVDVLLLRPLPYKQANRLAAIWDTEQGTKNTAQSTTAPRNYVRWGEAIRSFAHLALTQYIGYRLNDAQEPINGLAMEVTPNLFEMLGVSAAVGRAFAAGDERASDSRIAVLSYGLWQRQFGADPQVVGRSIRLNDQSYTVLGIMPSTFQFPPRLALTSDNVPDCCDLWVPLLLDDSRVRAPGKNYFAYGRLKAGVSIPQAQAEMDAFAPQLAKEFPDLNYRLSLQVGSLSDLTTRQVRPALLVLLGAVGLILTYRVCKHCESLAGSCRFAIRRDRDSGGARSQPKSAIATVFDGECFAGHHRWSYWVRPGALGTQFSAALRQCSQSVSGSHGPNCVGVHSRTFTTDEFAVWISRCLANFAGGRAGHTGRGWPHWIERDSAGSYSRCVHNC